jgi:hypothetical protein
MKTKDGSKKENLKKPRTGNIKKFPTPAQIVRSIKDKLLIWNTKSL